MAGSDPAGLDRLHDIVVPPPVPFWPPAPGWYVLALAFVLAVALAGWCAVRRWRADAYRRAALAELATMATPAARLDAVPALLKRVALTAYLRGRVARLSGLAWLDFLDRTARTDAFTAGPGRILAELPYDPGAAGRMSTLQVEQALAAATGWIRAHRVEPP